MPGKQASQDDWALVTGASAGIGEEFCRQLAALGYSIVLVARREQRLARLASELEVEHLVRCRSVALDLSRPEAGSELQSLIERDEIPVGFLVNNAGFGVPGYFTDSDWQVHADALQLMLNSVCELTWRLLPGMQQRGRGYIVNVASMAGLVPGSPGFTLYGATKAFLIRFSQSLALENESTGVNVSALCPGFTHSEFHDVADIREQLDNLPSWMWMDAPEVVRFGIEAVCRSKPEVIAIPGKANRTIASLVRVFPDFLSQALFRRMAR